MKKIMILLVVALCSACAPSATEKKMEVMPPELSDCQVFTIGDGMSYYTVFRCPGSTTTTSYMEGKVRKNVVVIDGKEYQEVVK